MKITIATRGSALALAQAHLVQAQAQRHFPDHEFLVKIYKTTGDKLQTASMSNPGASLPKGLFTKELEVALLEGEADLAVHSLKDLPTDLPTGLRIGAVLRREDVRDVMLYRGVDFASSAPLRVAQLPPGSVVASSSNRRAAQLQRSRPDLQIIPIRGNVGTRIEKLVANREITATLLALAGLRRLGYQVEESSDKLIGEGIPEGVKASVMSLEEMLPAVGQGAVAIEIRQADSDLSALVCGALNHAETHASVTAERSFLRGMGGGCQSPVAGYASVVANQLQLRVLSFLNQRVIAEGGVASLEQAEGLGLQIALKIRSRFN